MTIIKSWGKTDIRAAVFINEFEDGAESGKYIYRYSYLYQGDSCWTEEFETVFNSLKACRAALHSDVADLDETYFKEGGSGMIKYRIKKQSPEDEDIYYDLEFKGDHEFNYFHRGNHFGDWISDVLNESFDHMCFAFPTPFKKGDIVWIPCEDQFIAWNCDGGFVLEELTCWNTDEHRRDGSDISDITASGFFVNPNGTVYHENCLGYMNFEYYSEPYKLNEKILPALSKFIKDEISVDFLMCAYRKVLLDVAADDIMLRSFFPPTLTHELGIDFE